MAGVGGVEKTDSELIYPGLYGFCSKGNLLAGCLR